MAGDSTDTDAETFAERVFWGPHASPRSVWGFVATYPLVIAAIYYRDRRLLAGVLLAVVTNLGLSSPPETDEAWATRVVLGERAWLDGGTSSSSPEGLGVLAVGGVVQAWTFRAAVGKRPLRTAVGTVASLVTMGWFFDRMVRLYDETTEREPGDD
jgi:hypothetical protein